MSIVSSYGDPYRALYLVIPFPLSIYLNKGKVLLNQILKFYNRMRIK